MLERLRRNRHLGLGVLGVFALVLLVALWAGAQTRQALRDVAVLSDVCTGTGMESMALQPDAGEVPPHHHADPSCVLCLALSAPPVVAVWDYQPPSPHARWLWWAPEPSRPHPLFAPPPPQRGPPDLAQV